MNPAVKFILFLLALPFLIGIFLFIILPLVILLLILSLFIPSIRIFHTFHTPRGNGQPDPPRPDDTVEVECTVVESTENSDPESPSGQPPELNP